LANTAAELVLKSCGMYKLYIIFFWFSPTLIFSQIQLLNDEFDHDSTLSHWQNTTDVEGWNAEHLEEFDINTSTPGKLHIMPHTTGWFQDRRGPLLFKEVSGDFIFTTQVTAMNRAGTGIPQSLYSLAGPMIRTPRNFTNGNDDWTSGDENYVFLSIGYADFNNSNPPAAGPHFEVKTTHNSNSQLEIVPIPEHENVQIRIARIDDHVICMYKLPNGDWTIRRRYFRPDFPDTMQVGLVTYTDWGKYSTFSVTYGNGHVIDATANPDSSGNPARAYAPDLIGTFEYARFDTINVPPDLIDANLSNPIQVSDSVLIQFFGFPSQPYIPNNIHYAADSAGIVILVDNESDFINIIGDLSAYDVSILDSLENVIASFTNLHVNLTIDKSEIPEGIHFIVIEHALNGIIRMQRLVEGAE
jgi:regulation of enolase protein 1 (concanavalin A-like superfamily)